MSLNFVTYSDASLSVIDLDNAESEDLTPVNIEGKKEREQTTSKYLLPEEVFVKNRTVSKENQEKLLQKLMDDNELKLAVFTDTGLDDMDKMKLLYAVGMLIVFEESIAVPVKCRP